MASEISANEYLLDDLKPLFSEYLNDWEVVGTASSGDVCDNCSRQIGTFRVLKNDIVDCKGSKTLDESDYLSMFRNLDNEAAIASMSKSSIEINKESRNADSQERPVSLSALMICLYNPHGDNDFAYRNRNADTMAGGIPSSVKRVLPREGMPEEKTKIIAGGLAFLGTGINLRKPNALKGMLPELEENVIPFSNKGTNYDIIGRFHEEFLRFAGVTNVKKGDSINAPSHCGTVYRFSSYWV